MDVRRTKKKNTMGVCLCKDKVDDGTQPDHMQNGGGGGGLGGGGGGDDGIGSLDNVWPGSRYDRTLSLSETVNRLVKETLDVIGTIVDKYTQRISHSAIK